MNQSVFSDAITIYHGAQWPAIIPVPPDKKFPPPAGFTGDSGADTTPEILVNWATGGFAHYSVALRMPEGVIGIDVDHYLTGSQQKTGDDTLQARIALWGPLPPTWHSTARGDDNGSGPSRIMFFRAPAGRYRNSLPDIDIIQRHHRYAVVAPSPHGSVPGAFYRWYRPDGSPAAPGEVPRPDELPELPPAWVEGLREGATGAGLPAADIGSGHTMLAALLADEREPCTEIVAAYDFALRELQAADGGTRHDTMVARVHRLVLAGAAGHPGVGPGLRELTAAWDALTAGENRSGEFENMLLTSARKAVSASGPTPVNRDPCLLMGRYGTGNPATGHAAGPPPQAMSMMTPGAARPVDDRDAEDAEPLPEPIEAPEPWSWIEGIGAHPFDPSVDKELRLADAVLERTWPMLRYVTDAKDTWLQRGPRCWELFRGINRRAVTECARLMPDGDPNLPANKADYTPANWQSVRKGKLHTNGPINNVATLMQTTVAGGRHPSAVRLADLDARPDVLWAGGMAYDIRASAEGPAFAVDIDANTPHLMSAGVAPALVPTPAWDAFLAAVWPDPEVRAWAMRVLSIAVTGEADAALPILLGPGGTGKTSVVHLLMSLLGSYAHAANPKLLLAGDNSHDTIVYELKGRRLSFIDEGPREGRLAQERLKQLTGGGMLTGRPMNTDPFTFAPTHTLVLTANDEPLLTDEALRRRVRLIPCTGDVAAVRAARARLVGATWRREAPGALAAVMAQAARWYAEPVSAATGAAPISIRGLAEEMAAEQDPFQEWFHEALEPCPNGTPASTLRDAYNAWAERVVGRWARRLNHRTFAKAMRALGLESQARRDCNYYLVRFRGSGSPWEGPTPPVQAGQPPVVVPAVVRGGSDSTTPTTENSRSTTFSSTSVGVVEVVEGSIYKEEEGGTPYGVVPRIYTAEGGNHPQQPQLISDSSKKGGLPATEQVADVPPEAPQDPPEGPVQTELIFDLGSAAGQPPFPELHTPTEPSPAPKATRARLTPEEKAERAAARKAAKAAEKAAAREQAILDAGGGHHALPVVVDRAGLVLPCTPEQARELVAAGIAAQGSLTVDVETSGYPVGHAEHVLRTVQLGHAGLAVVFDPVAHAEQIRALLDQAPRLHAHSATADLVPLAHAGLIDDIEHAWDRMHDTVIPAKLADPASTGSDPGLKQLAGVVLGEAATAPAADTARAALFKAGGWLTDTEVDTPVERSGWAQVDSGSAVMARYAASDVLDTAALALRLPPVDDAGLYGRERLAQRMTARVAHRGLRLDPDHVAEMTRRHREGQEETGARVRAHGGIDNPGSTAQVAAKVVELGGELPQTKGGKPSAAKDALEPLRGAEGALGAFVGDVLAYRHHSTALSLFLTPYGHLCERGDGRVRPTVYTLGTDTGRMSCVRPNLQQLSRKGGMRACITADPGQLLISADFSGVELRVAAAVSGDPTLVQMLADGRDLHMEVAKMAFGPDATTGDRSIAKRAVFGRLYGGGIPALARQVGVSESIMAAIVASLDEITPVLAQWSAGMRRAVQQGHTQYPAYSGRTIHLPRAFPHKAPNYVIQGTARELLIDALVRWSDTPWGTCTLVPVHDELIVAVPEDQALDALAELERCMTSEINGIAIVAESDPPMFAWQDV